MLQKFVGDIVEEAPGWYVTAAEVRVPCLANARVEVVFRGVGNPLEDPGVAEAVAALFSLSESDLRVADRRIGDLRAASEPSMRPHQFDSADLWRQLVPVSVHVFRGYGAGPGVHVSLVFACGWDREHGLKLTFLRGAELIRVGAADDFC